METMTRGSRKPDLTLTLADAAGEADFSTLTTADVVFRGEMDGALVFSGVASEVVPAADGKSALVSRPWGVDETETVGRMWISVDVDWGSDHVQTFPHDGPLRIDIVRGPGDA